MSSSKRMSIPLFLLAGAATVLIAFLVRDKRPPDNPVDQQRGLLNDWESDGGSLVETGTRLGGY